MQMTKTWDKAFFLFEIYFCGHLKSQFAFDWMKFCPYSLGAFGLFSRFQHPFLVVIMFVMFDNRNPAALWNFCLFFFNKLVVFM